MKKTIIILITLLLAVGNSFSASAGTAAKTKYPFVLVHGLFGFDQILALDYFYRIPNTLRREGADVFVAQVSSANTTEVRGEQLIDYIDQVLAITGAEKVNLIGHSHGGPTVRYAGSVAPEKVASVASVAGVNWGSRVADAIQSGVEEGSVLEGLAGVAVNSLANLIELLSGNVLLPTDAIAAGNALTTEQTLIFNQRYPEGVPSAYCRNDGEALADNGVHYASWSGGSLATNFFDSTDSTMVLLGTLFFNEKNDGLVASCSSQLGRVYNDRYRMNHSDVVNQIFGLTSIFETDPVQVFVAHANRMKRLGL